MHCFYILTTSALYCVAIKYKINENKILTMQHILFADQHHNNNCVNAPSIKIINFKKSDLLVADIASNAAKHIINELAIS